MLHILRYALVFAFCLTASFAHAQLSFAQTDYATPGDTQLVGIDTTTATLQAGSAGMGQTWDFSALAVDDSTTVQVTDGSGTPYASDFPDAEVAFQINTLYVYQENDADTLNDLGLGIEVELSGTTFDRAVRYSEPFKSAVFPITMNATWNDEASFTVGATSAEVGQNIPGADSVRWTRTTNKTVTVDGTGTLYLPNDTIADVLRVMSTEYHRDDFEAKFVLGGWSTLNVPGIVESPSFDTTHTYTYYSSGFKLPVMNYTVGLDDSVGDGGVSFHHPPRETIISAVQPETLTGIKVFPNPVEDGRVRVELREALAGETALTIVGMDGRTVYTQRLHKGSTGVVDCDLHGVAKGVYLLRQTNRQGVYTQRIVVR